MEKFTTTTGQRLKVHDKKDCSGCCVIHFPKDSHMKDWPLHWRDDRGFFERIDPMGCGHPAEEDVIYHKKLGNDISEHGCTGLCNTKNYEEYLKKVANGLHN